MFRVGHESKGPRAAVLSCHKNYFDALAQGDSLYVTDSPYIAPRPRTRFHSNGVRHKESVLRSEDILRFHARPFRPNHMKNRRLVPSLLTNHQVRYPLLGYLSERTEQLPT